MKINIRRTDNDYLLEAANENGNTLLMDGSLKIGGHEAGMSPMQVLLSSVGGCSAIDVISILRKQRQEIASFEMEITGDKVPVESHSEYKSIELHFILKGRIEPDKAYRAAELSHSKYCSVSKALEQKSKITFTVTVNGETVQPS